MQTSQRTPNRPVGRRRAVAQTDLREQLLNGAIQLFSQQGVAATTVARIAKAVGVTPAMVHYHFTSRELLLDAVADERLAPLARHVWSDEVLAVDGPEAMVHALVERFFGVIEQLPWLPALWISEVINPAGQLHERMKARLPFDRIQRFTQAMAKAQREGRINPDIDPGMLFTSLLGLVMLPMATAPVWQGKGGLPALDIANCKRHALALLGSGLQPARKG